MRSGPLQSPLLCIPHGFSTLSRLQRGSEDAHNVLHSMGGPMDHPPPARYQPALLRGDGHHRYQPIGGVRKRPPHQHIQEGQYQPPQMPHKAGPDLLGQDASTIHVAAARLQACLMNCFRFKLIPFSLARHYF